MPLSLHRMLLLGLTLTASTARAASGPAPAPARPRAAIPEFQVEGETSPALVLQLQDGFVVGLTRAGVEVLDSVDVGQRIQRHPELEKCDNSICLKRLAEVLDVRYLLRVRVNVSGNSYRMTARLFHTEGNSPAVLPALTQSRFCDVCTVAEAREVMIRLADAIRHPLDETPAVAQQAPQAPGRAVLPLVALGTGLAALAGGTALYLSAGRSAKGTSAIGGALMGAGLTATGIGVYLMVVAARSRITPAVALTMRW
jgi:TolB-like protein